jgi:ribosome-associated protein
VLRITASEERSQHRNREAAEGRLVTLVTEALHVPRVRRKTRPPRASRERRLAAKRRRSETKRLRDSVSDD